MRICRETELLANLIDYLRCEPDTPRCTTRLTKSDIGAFEAICVGSTTDSSTALCLFGKPGDTND
jgi:hypothetical protein